MEIRDIFKKIKKYRRSLLFSAVAGFIIGSIFSTLPPKYISTGSIYVKSGINPGTEYFTYEGYYAQQAALSYTNSVIALLESPDIKRNVLKLMDLSVDEKNIRELNKVTNIKKTGPQVILITVKDKNYDVSRDIWDKTVNSLIGMTTKMNRGGDEYLGISLISEDPVIKEAYRSFYLFSFIGLLLGISFCLFYICIREYFR